MAAKDSLGGQFGKKVGYRSDHAKWWDVQNHALHETEELGNAFPDVSGLKEHEGIWVTHDWERARQYGDDIYEVDLSGADMLHEDDDGGYFYVRPKRNK